MITLRNPHVGPVLRLASRPPQRHALSIFVGHRTHEDPGVASWSTQGQSCRAPALIAARHRSTVWAAEPLRRTTPQRRTSRSRLVPWSAKPSPLRKIPTSTPELDRTRERGGPHPEPAAYEGHHRQWRQRQAQSSHGSPCLPPRQGLQKTLCAPAALTVSSALPMVFSTSWSASENSSVPMLATRASKPSSVLSIRHKGGRQLPL